MLEGASGFVRRQLGRVLETRTIPALAWEYDPSSEDAANISKLINEARRRDEAIRGEQPAPPAAAADPGDREDGATGIEGPDL
jgi:hypothetical protein